MKINEICKAAGWQRATNNIHRLPGVEFVPAGPGAFEPSTFNQSVWFVGDSFIVLNTTHHGEPYASSFGYDHEAIARFDTLADLLSWLEVNGKRSEGGQPAGSCGVWD
jgi:hypothetical protein